MKNHNPPEKFRKFLEWFCPESLFESIAGDLEEEFYNNLEEFGYKKARSKYIIQVILFFRPGILFRNKFGLAFYQPALYGSYIKIAGRNIARQKLFSLINSLGLGLGIAFCILISLFIKDELSFDQFHDSKDSIYRIEKKYYKESEESDENNYFQSAFVQVGLAPALKEKFPQVKYATRYNRNINTIIHYKDKTLSQHICYVDPDFFKMFSFDIVKGNYQNPLSELHYAVISKDVANKIFGSEDVIGKVFTIERNGKKEFVVNAIIENPPPNSSIDYNILIRQENKPYYTENANNWRSFSTPTFVQLTENADLKAFETNLDKLIQLNFPDYLQRIKDRYKLPDNKMIFKFKYVSLNDVHLYANSYWHNSSDKKYSLILGSIAVLILFIAAINYILLALSTSLKRRKEVGVRKVIGARKNQVLTQFTLESIIISTLSAVLGIFLVYLFLPAFNSFTQKSISLRPEQLDLIIPLGIVLGILIGLVSGSYPAFYLSSFRPIPALKGGLGNRIRANFSKPLIVIQFSISAFLIISSLIMYQQMDFITHKNLGYDKDNILVIPTQQGWGPESNNTLKLFREKLQNYPEIESITGTSSAFSHGWSHYGYTIDNIYKTAYVYCVDEKYIPTFNIDLVQGRNFNESFKSDSNAIIVNEALVKDMAWDNPLDEYLNWQEDSNSVGSNVIGVMKDYHFLSLENKIEPLFLSLNSGYLIDMLVKVQASNTSESLAIIEKSWNELNPDKPFEYSFLDQDLASQYEKREKWMSIMELATLFAIFISCMGLFGLSGINAHGRMKEMGIRKIFGAPVSSIYFLLNSEFLKLSSISFILAIPVSYYIMSEWLQGFEYAIKIGWQVILFGILSGLLTAISTVSYHALKTALLNPAATLKDE